MSTNPKKILKEIRKARNIELQNYKNILASISLEKEKIKQLITQRKNLLILELPFKTDTVSLNKASVTVYSEKLQKYQEKKPKGITAKDVYYDSVNKKGTSGKAFENRLLVFNLLTQNGFLPLKYFDTKQKKEFSIPAKDLHIILRPDKAIKYIDTLDIAKSSKQTYRSIAKSLFKEILCYKNVNSYPSSLPKGINLENLAQFFEFLELKCLNARTERPFIDLIAIRAIFYASKIKIHQLFKMSFEDLKNSSISFPKTFYSLASSIDPKYSVFPNKITASNLYKKVTRLAAKCKLEDITPNSIKRSLDYICNSLDIYKEYYPFLPKR